MKWVSKRDLTAIAALLLAALLLLWMRNGGAESGARFEIVVEGKIVLSGGLTPEREFILDGWPDMAFAVQGGRVAITRSDCPDKTCVRTGFIGIPGQISACLPNGLLIRIIGDGGVDAVI
ncbi:MAG: NusG domain II-containing protein [Oscillospiraceae bacterium]|jgi:hypothetical protein|nr:NusG domain II-containing protein [Oscillospiraceae bacterium]